MGGLRVYSALLLGWSALACSASGVEDEVSTGAPVETLGLQQQPLGTIPSQPGCLSTALSANPTTIYVSPTGDDANPGSQALPVATLAGAQAKISPDYTTDHLILVRGGEYRGQSVEWTRVSSTARIRIEAFPGETPVFDGRDAGSPGGNKPHFFFLSPVNGTTPVATNVVVKGLTIKYYVQTGFSLGQTPLDGGGEAAGVAQKCTTLVDNTLTHIGSLHGDCVTPSSGPSAGVLVINRPACVTGPSDNYGCSCIGYGAIDLMHSGSNSFKDNKIIKAENLSAKVGLIHAFYVAYKSSNNLIENNYVREISGTPFKFRDASSNNTAIGNYADRAGRSAFFSDSPELSKGETYSANNHLAGNVLTFSYNGAHNDVAVTGNTGSPPSFTYGTNQTSPRYYQGDTPTEEVVTASTSADVDGDQKEDVFVAFHYPGLGFSKVVYSVGGSNELSEVAYSSDLWQVSALTAGDFAGAGVNVIAAFWNGGTSTQIQRGLIDTDGVYRFGAGTLLNSSGASFWKVTGLAAGKVAGAAQTKLFTAISTGGVQQIHRGDGFTLPSGSTSLGVSEGPLVYSSSNWAIPAMTAGKVDGSGNVRLVTAFRWLGSGTPKNRIYIGTGAASGVGATDVATAFDDPAITISALTSGKFDGSNERLVTGVDDGGVGKVYLSSLSGGVVEPRGTLLYSNSAWDIASLTRSETRSTSSGDELVTAFHKSNGDQIWSGNGTSASSGATGLDEYYRWP
jgi:hypothetical protein